MTIAWQVAVVLLFVFNIALAIVVLGVLRRAVNFLESQRSDAPPNSMHDHEGFQRLGEHLPVLDGVVWPDEAFTLVLLEEGCVACRSLAADVLRYRRDIQQHRQPVHFIVDSAEHGFARVARTFPTTVDPDRVIFAALGVTESPLALVIAPDRRIVASSHPNTVRALLSIPDNVLAEHGHDLVTGTRTDQTGGMEKKP